MSEPVLQVKNLKVYYYVEAGAVKAVDDVSFDLDFGVKMGLVGESGSGKSTMALALDADDQTPWQDRGWADDFGWHRPCRTL